ncbi:hypothetical protein C8R46DRAFT_1037824 [Mycena filopes]|nr:hypothetical protein C8R46DRAFT_1037824 [Mycena filopes]
MSTKARHMSAQPWVDGDPPTSTYLDTCQPTSVDGATERSDTHLTHSHLLRCLRLVYTALDIAQKEFLQRLNSELNCTVERQWQQSPRYTRTLQYDPRLLKGSYLDITDRYPRSLTVLLLQLRTGHRIPLAKHLHKIQKRNLPSARAADKQTSRWSTT